MLPVLFLFACSASATTSETNGRDTTTVTSKMDTSSMPAYDPLMEPLMVGAKYSKKLGDTLGVKMYEFTMKPALASVNRLDCLISWNFKHIVNLTKSIYSIR